MTECYGDCAKCGATMLIEDLRYQRGVGIWCRFCAEKYESKTGWETIEIVAEGEQR